MGSHGAATPEGQAEVLAHFGITESSIGCPVISRADVVSLGRTDDGIDVFMDAEAHAADAVMIVARVKWHTSFSGRIESGLMKMMAIGLGKFAGAQNTTRTRSGSASSTSSARWGAGFCNRER